MSVQERFSEEELFLLASTPNLVGTMMVFAEGSGLGTIKEMYANSKSFINGAKKFPNNEIITTILPDITDMDDVKEKTKSLKEKSIEAFKEQNIKSQEEMKSYALSQLENVVSLLGEKATQEESSEYKEWILSILENIANAAKEGGFLGFGGERISEGEKETFAEVANILGVDAKLG